MAFESNANIDKVNIYLHLKLHIDQRIIDR